jgi:P27 family predicted phage terminase small subunit
MWDEAKKHLQDANVLTEMDALALAAFCESYATWREATDKIRRAKSQGGGLVIETVYGQKANPYLKIANNAHDRMLAILREFGMTPASRTRVKTASPTQPKQNRFAAILGGKSSA